MLLDPGAVHDERRPSSPAAASCVLLFSQKRDAVTHRSRAAHMISSTINQPHHVSYPTYVRTSRSCARPRTYVRAGVVPCRCTRGSRCRSSLPGRRQTIHQLRRHGWLAATCRGRGYHLLAVARWLAVSLSSRGTTCVCTGLSLSLTHTTYESEEKGKGGQADESRSRVLRCSY
jgi:hypothetical protein